MTTLINRKPTSLMRVLAPWLLAIALAGCQPAGGEAADASVAAPAAAPVAVASPVPPASDAATSGIHVDQAWIRATPPGAPAAGGFLQLHNAGGTDDRLLSVTTAAAARTEIHEVTEVDGVARMRPLADGLALPAGGAVSLAPGGYHLMLLEPVKPLVEGERVEATLRFAQAPEQRVVFAVRSLTATSSADGDGHAH